MERRKPPAAGKGRVKGTPNKITADLKAMILGALNQRGGQKWLHQQMEKQPVAFMTLLGKVLPTVVAATVDQTVTVSIEERRAKARELIEAAFSGNTRDMGSGETRIH